jgi:hypothetical protein
LESQPNITEDNNTEVTHTEEAVADKADVEVPSNFTNEEGNNIQAGTEEPTEA